MYNEMMVGRIEIMNLIKLYAKQYPHAWFMAMMESN